MSNSFQCRRHGARTAFLVVACLGLVLADFSTSVAATPPQHRNLIHSPIRSNGGRVSLEWAIDASDAIVQVKLDTQGQPQPGQVHKRPDAFNIVWPEVDRQRLRAICELYEPDDQIAFFLWHNSSEKSWQIFDYIPLISDRARQERLRASQALLPPPDQSERRMSHLLKERDAGLTWLAIDKKGKWIGDDAVILERIVRRVKSGSRIPRGADRQAVLEGQSQFGGFYVYEPQEPTVSSDEFPAVLVPPDQEYRESYLRIVRNQPSHQGQLEAFQRIGNYDDAEVIAALKMRLSDNLIHEVIYEQPGRKLRGSRFFILKPDDPPLKPEPNREKSRTYIIRRAAWNALRQMGVDVEPPEFQAK